MHSQTTKDQFVELRAEGKTLDAISQQIGVPKPTLGRWNLECLEQIQRLRALQWELLEDQMGNRFEDSLIRIARRIRCLEDQLDSRSPERFTRIELMRVIRQSRLDYLKLRAILMAPLQPSRGRTPCVADLDPAKRDKTRRNSDSPNTTSLPQNDLQQPEPPVSHSATIGGAPVLHSMPAKDGSSVEPQTSPQEVLASTVERSTESDNLRMHEEPATALPPPRGEGWGEGQTGSPAECNQLSTKSKPLSAESNDAPSHLPTFPPAHLPDAALSCVALRPQFVCNSGGDI